MRWGCKKICWNLFYDFIYYVTDINLKIWMENVWMKFISFNVMQKCWKLSFFTIIVVGNGNSSSEINVMNLSKRIPQEISVIVDWYKSPEVYQIIKMSFNKLITFRPFHNIKSEDKRGKKELQVNFILSPSFSTSLSVAFHKMIDHHTNQSDYLLNFLLLSFFPLISGKKKQYLCRKKDV